MPAESQISILLSDDSVLKDCTYHVTSSNIKSVDGYEVSFDETSYIKTEFDADIYSTSILSVYYSQAGRQLFYPPCDGDYTMYTQIVNSGRSDAAITLEYYITSSYGNEDIIEQKSISIGAGSSAIVSTLVSGQNGRRVNVRLK
ncbi:MAG: hypothetical protein IKK96_05830 [Lachnospiraceae bacterium]|nr:hypothetical protein [Lachnospiraceae bacterium]